MDRRKFLRWLSGTASGAAAAHTLDLDKLLWVPGERTIFLPPPPKWDLFYVGDVFTIDGQFATNPLTGASLTHLQYFVATDVEASGKPVPYPRVSGPLHRWTARDFSSMTPRTVKPVLMSVVSPTFACRMTA